MHPTVQDRDDVNDGAGMPGICAWRKCESFMHIPDEMTISAIAYRFAVNSYASENTLCHRRSMWCPRQQSDA